MTGFFDSFQQARQQGYERGQQNRLQGLMQQAWNAPEQDQGAITAQIAGINPQAAAGMERRSLDRRDRLQTDAVNLARAWKSSANATPEQRQAFYQSFIAPQAQRRGLPLPPAYDAAAFDQEADALIAMGQGGQMPTDVRSFQMMTQGLSPEEQLQARRINLGLEGRASSSGFSQVKFTDPQGRERIGVLNGKTGQIDLPDGTSFNPQTGAISQSMGGPTRGDMEADARLANELIAAGIPEMQVDAFLAARGQRAQGIAPPIATRADTFTGRRKEDEAGAVTAAQEAAKLGYLPQEMAIRTDAAIQQAAGTQAAKDNAERVAAAPGAIQTLQTSLDSIDALLASPDLGSIVGIGSMNPINQIPGTAARGLIARADQIAGQAFLAAFNQLKGGGAITEREGAAATAAMARLDRSQSLADYKQALSDLKAAISPAIERQRRLLSGSPQPSGSTDQRRRALLDKY